MSLPGKKSLKSRAFVLDTLRKSGGSFEVVLTLSEIATKSDVVSKTSSKLQQNRRCRHEQPRSAHNTYLLQNPFIHFLHIFTLAMKITQAILRTAAARSSSASTTRTLSSFNRECFSFYPTTKRERPAARVALEQASRIKPTVTVGDSFAYYPSNGTTSRRAMQPPPQRTSETVSNVNDTWAAAPYENVASAA